MYVCANAPFITPPGSRTDKRIKVVEFRVVEGNAVRGPVGGDTAPPYKQCRLLGSQHMEVGPASILVEGVATPCPRFLLQAAPVIAPDVYLRLYPPLPFIPIAPDEEQSELTHEGKV